MKGGENEWFGSVIDVARSLRPSKNAIGIVLNVGLGIKLKSAITATELATMYIVENVSIARAAACYLNPWLSESYLISPTSSSRASLGLPFFMFCDKMIGIMAKKNNTKRKLVGLVSEESGVRAYYTKKNTMNTPDKLSLKKYDPILRKHVVFTETKKNLGRNEVKEKKR